MLWVLALTVNYDNRDDRIDGSLTAAAAAISTLDRLPAHEGVPGRSSAVIRLVSWNIAKRRKAVDWLLEMDLDAALLQECHPGLLEDAASKGRLEFSPHPPLGEEHYDRWPMIVRLSDRVAVDWFRQTVPRYSVKEDEVSVGGIRVIEIARLAPADGTAAVCGRIDLRALDAAAPDNQQQLGRRLPGRLRPRRHHRPFRLHRTQEPGHPSHPGGGGLQHHPGRDRKQSSGASCTGRHYFRPDGRAGAGAPGAETSRRPAGRPLAIRSAGRHQQRADIPLDTAVSEDGGESARLRLCLTGFPTKGSMCGR